MLSAVQPIFEEYATRTRPIVGVLMSPAPCRPVTVVMEMRKNSVRGPPAQGSGRAEVEYLFELFHADQFRGTTTELVNVVDLEGNPFSNPTAPPGPCFMPEYRNPQILQGASANRKASRIFDEGMAARKHSEEYTETTVVLATVLFLVALSPRFRSRRVRFALLLLTGGLAVYALATIVTFPRL